MGWGLNLEAFGLLCSPAAAQTQHGHNVCAQVGHRLRFYFRKSPKAALRNLASYCKRHLYFYDTSLFASSFGCFFLLRSVVFKIVVQHPEPLRDAL